MMTKQFSSQGLFDLFQARPVRYALAVVAVACAVLMREALDPFLGNYLPLPTFFMAILAVSGLCGLGPGLVCSALGYLAVDWYFLVPRYSFNFRMISDWVNFGSYVLVALPIVLFGYLMRKAQENALSRQAAMEREIAERKRAEEALRDSEQRYSATLASIGDAVIATDVDSRVAFMNTIAEDLTGWKLAEAADRPLGEVFNIINELTRVKAEDPVARALACGATVGLANHTLLLRRDGTEIPIDDSAAPIKNREGVITGVVLVFRDITDRKRAEEALRESREDLNRAQTVGNIGNWRLNVRRNELLWSEENYRIFGVPMGTPLTYEIFLSIVHPDDRDYVDKQWREAMAGKAYDIEHRIITDGKVKWVREKAFLEFDEEGAVLSGFGITQDITDRKRVEEALRQSEQRLRRLYESGLMGVFYWNMGGKIIDANDRFLEMVGYTRQELEEGAIDWLKMTPPEYRLIDERAVKELMATGINKVPYEKEYILKNGKRLPILIAGAMLDKERFDGVAFVLDITERKHAEDILKRDKETFEMLVKERTGELLEAKLELERAKRLSDIGTLAATVAHELRNPLAAIHMAAHNIKKRGDAPVLRNHLETIDKKVAESEQIISNLLFYSRLKPPQYGSVEVYKELADSIKTAGTRFSNTSVDIAADPIQGVVIEADALQLKEVFHNILNNAGDAVRHLGDKGKVEISAKANKESVIICVKDNGVGMSPETLEKAAEPFYTTKSRGTGLGLTVSQQIIEMHNGKMKLRSREGKGTTVFIHLPRKNPRRFRKE